MEARICQRPSAHQRPQLRLCQAPATAPLHQAPCAGDGGSVTSGPRVLSNDALQSQEEIIVAIGHLTAEVRNVTNCTVGHLLCNKKI